MTLSGSSCSAKYNLTHYVEKHMLSYKEGTGSVHICVHVYMYIYIYGPGLAEVPMCHIYI